MSIRNLFVVCVLSFVSVCVGQGVPRSSHVWVINEENHSYEEIVGNSQMPYYNQLISQYGLAAQFYSDQHSSLPALMWFVAGAAVERNSDSVSCQHNNDNVVRELLAQGYTWKSYQSNLPYAGFIGLFGGTDGSYYRRHNPLIDFTDVCPGTGQDLNDVPFTQMATDFAQGNTVNYAWITPDSNDDAHNGTLQAADQWLQNNVPSILARPEFSPGGDGILFIVWDEGGLSNDSRCSASVSKGCGGRTATLVIGPQVTSGYQSTTTYHNENVLATVCAAMGLSPCPGAAQDAAPMAEFFNGATQPSTGVSISNPGSGATVTGPLQLIASVNENQTVSETQVWDNGVKLGVFGNLIHASFNLLPGKHTTTVIDLDSSWNVIHRAAVTYNVQSEGDGVQIISPTQGAAISGVPVHVVAYASEAAPVNQIQVWDNGTRLGRYAGTDVNQYFSLGSGAHTLTVLDLDGNFNVISESSVSYTVQ